jgi:hypothetical protein
VPGHCPLAGSPARPLRSSDGGGGHSGEYILYMVMLRGAAMAGQMLEKSSYLYIQKKSLH